VPFPALRNGEGQDLIEVHTMLTAPSIQVLGLTQDLATGTDVLDAQSVLVVGNPTMPTVWSPEQGGTRQALPRSPVPSKRPLRSPIYLISTRWWAAPPPKAP
jgi:hypothetical protein